MSPSSSKGLRIGFGCAIAVMLLTWNGVLSSFANPFVLLSRYDGVQYQLLARNRLHGHCEMGDLAHTVHEEGQHPMWRPGLVWIEEGLARCLGSVHKGAAAASGLGTTLLELALLYLAWRCFGNKTFLFLLIALALPAFSFPFWELAVGQGPEVWAAAATVAGLAILVEGLQRGSACWALSAGIIAGLAEWFRTGNLLLFAIPCAVYSAAALRQRDYHAIFSAAAAFAAWLGMAACADLAVTSSINKNIANLWACRADIGGPIVTEKLADGSSSTFSMLHYILVPGKSEIYIDEVLRDSRGQSTLAYLCNHAGEIACAYAVRLQEAAANGFSGLREKIGDLVVSLFVVALALCLARRDQAARHTFALAGGALGHYLGPVVLLVGDAPSHYLLVAMPLFVLVGLRGVIRLARLFRGGRLLPVSLCLSALVCGIPFYRDATSLLRHFQEQSARQQAAVDALQLDGQRVACRNMAWFVDRDVQTVLLPYATVPELATYAQAHAIDGILIWDDETTFFRATPYGSPSEFARALQDSELFAPLRSAGGWHWYPLSRRDNTKEQP
jgi:hypothetical protein